MLVPVILVMHLAGADTLAEPKEVALAPLIAERASLDELAAFEHLDGALRKGVASVPGVHLQDAGVTRANIDAAAGAGVACGGRDRACLGKLAVLAGVERLLVPSATRTGGVMTVSLFVVDGGARSADVRSLLPVGPDDAQRAAARQLATRALAAVLAAPVADARGEGARVAAPRGAPRAAPFPLGGAVLLAAGGGVAAAGVAGAFVTNELLATPEPYADRSDKLFFGQASLVVAAAGVAAAAAGGAVLLLSE